MPLASEGGGYVGPNTSAYTFINLHGVPLIYQAPSAGQPGWLQMPDGSVVQGITDFKPQQGIFRTKDGHVVTLQSSVHTDQHGEPVTSYRLIGHTPQGLLDPNVPDTTYWSSKPGFTLQTPQQIQAQAKKSGGQYVEVAAPKGTPTQPAGRTRVGATGGVGGVGGGSGTGGGGGFGGGGGAGGGLAPATTYNAAQLEAQYGYASLFFKDTGLQKLVQQAVKEQWDPQNFAAHLMGTSWYKTHSAAQRQWEQLRTSDPAEARAQQAKLSLQISDQASKDGVTLSPARLAQITNSALQYGWDQSKVNAALGAEYKYNASNPGQIATGLKQQASQYLVPMDDKTLQTWSQHMIAGSVDQGAFDAYLKEQAKSLFPGMSTAIDSGVTPATYVAPYQKIAADTLEVPADSVNFLDPKWGKALFQVDPKTGARTSMSLADWANTLRTDPTYGWDKTNQAKSQSADLIEKMKTTFGAA